MVNVGFRHAHKMRGLASVSQESPIRVGLIGFGFVSKTFHIPLLQATDGYRTTAVSSSRPADVSAVLPDVEVGSDTRRYLCCSQCQASSTGRLKCPSEAQMDRSQGLSVLFERAPGDDAKTNPAGKFGAAHRASLIITARGGQKGVASSAGILPRIAGRSGVRGWWEVPRVKYPVLQADA
jgi:hypothetical protein